MFFELLFNCQFKPYSKKYVEIKINIKISMLINDIGTIFFRNVILDPLQLFKILC